ncbi:hypothetical protein K432DRAFT_382601 [Lepidopterella palustris CBS 459.81]|uniref:BTB domain-containing protein n=1 Tax=Lepidopterella palustris CBS 459.81 TaxID=1314670 RepID=A0A8E2JFE2_9PEZI|nr:hypothetical protein K432DRAFT_382601 [Lepidopterella palustris CBS 459.81]
MHNHGQQQTNEQDTSENPNYIVSALNIDQPSRPPTWSFDNTAPTGNDTAGPSTSSRPSLFSPGTPSIFSSAPSTSPIITTDATRPTIMTTSPSSSSRPLATLASTSAIAARRTARFEDNASSPSQNNNKLSTAEKDADDPTTPIEGRGSTERREYTTLTTLSRLFASHTSPDTSRAPSYNQSAGPMYTRSIVSEAATLPDHLYTRGLLGGRHSDITVVAFGHKYALHRLILDRAPFFTTALSEPWLESRAKEITLHPEEIDSSISQSAFELALKRLYGVDISQEEDAEAIGLFATGCWLEMQDLVDSSIDAILRQMSPETLSPLIKLVTANYYGRAGERILACAKSMLCRDGWEMPLRYWDGIPGDVIREIVGGDGFFVDGEWDRWVLAKRLLDRRLKHKAIEAGLIERGKKPITKAPNSLRLMAVRFDAVYRQNSIIASRPTPDSHHSWLALYTNPDIEPLLVLLDEGIHYIHLDFEQLQFIRQARDILGLPVMPEKAISNALWQQMELRQKVLNAGDLDMELGLSKPAEELAANQQSAVTVASSKESMSPLKGKQKQGNETPEEDDEEMDSGSWDANGKPRKFWIPSTDCNIVMGGNAEPVVTTSTSFQRHVSRMSATLQPEDVQWATDFASSPSTSTNPNTRSDYPARPGSASGSNAGQPKPIAYTHYPPFRFSAEFPNPRLLKEKKRVYSRTVFYAGSLWNIYIQKVRSAKNVQLGVYLHRAKEREAEEAMTSGGIGMAPSSIGSVDERIGLLEREMLLRSERRERRRGRGSGRAEQNEQPAEEDTSGSGGDPDATLVSTGSRNPLIGSASALARRRYRLSLPNNTSGPFAHPTSSTTGAAHGTSSSSNLLNFPALSSSPPSDGDPIYPAYTYAPSSPSATSSDTSDSDPDTAYPNPTLSLLAPRKSRAATATLPPYVDARPTIKTYFKIYSPSKGGRLLSVYESAPDRFNFSQSWGWKSSTLMLDEVCLNGREDGGAGGAGAEQADGTAGRAGQHRRAGDGKLRFMVVIGNL